MRKLKVKKGIKLGNLVVLGMLVFCLVKTSGVTAMASNYMNREYGYCFVSEGLWDTIKEEFKDDFSSTYMFCTYSEIPGSCYSAMVIGYSTSTDSNFEASQEYVYGQGTERFMTNFVRENGGDLAFVKGKLLDSCGVGSGLFSGVWSPDSI